MKVLQVQNINGIAGSERYLLQIMPALSAEKGVKFQFLILIPPNPSAEVDSFIDKLKALGVKYYCIQRRLSNLNQIAQVINKGGFDLVHTHLIHADFYLAMTKCFYRFSPKIVSTKHGYDEKHQALYALDYKKKPDFFWLTSAIAEKFIFKSFAVSEGVRSLFVKKSICKPQRISVIYHGINCYENQKVKMPAISKEKVLRIITVGRILPLKGHKYALDALKIMEDLGYTNFEYFIIGDGKLLEDLKTQVHQLGLNNKVFFKGYQSNPYKADQPYHLALIPSIGEGFGLVVLEALCHKLPVVAFNLSAINEIVENEKNGMLVKPRSEFALAEAIIFLTESEAFWLKFESHQKETLAKFSFNKTVENTYNFYKKVLNE